MDGASSGPVVGLIEVSDLEQLDAIRWDLDGDGKADDDSGIEAYAAAFPLSGEEVVCNDNCYGYELARPLDFAAADSYASGTVSAEWTMGEGWRPKGDGWHPFAATFNGNGHAVSNLYVTPTTRGDGPSADGFGLFGSVGVSGVVRETGLLNVNVVGGDFVGPLVGANQGTVSHSYATGSVSGYGCVGGLVGSNDFGVINSSCSTGNVSGGRKYLGGLAGGNEGIVAYSYSVGKVSSDGSIDAPLQYVGGLVGYNPGIISSALWDTETSGQQVGIGIEIGDGQSSDLFGKTTAELQSPAGYTGPYQGWDVCLFIEGAENTPDYRLGDYLGLRHIRSISDPEG